MWSLALANVRTNLGRLFATLLAIAVGVTFLTAASMFVRSIQNSLGGAIETAYVDVDAAVTYEPEVDYGGGPDPARNAIPDDVRTSISELPGVSEVAGEVVGFTSLLRADSDLEANAFESGQTLRNWIDGPLATLEMVDGRAPEAQGEIAIDRRTAEDESVGVGDTISISTTVGATEVTVVGISALSDADSLDPTGTVSVASSWVHDIAGTGDVEWTDLLIDFDDSVAPAEGIQSVRDATPDTFTVSSGDDFREQATGTAGEFGDILRPILQGFAFLALFVCSIVIYNTYAVVVAQRSRELALMRAVAATPRQVWLSLCVEGLVVGILGSALGVLGGAALTSGLLALLDRFGRGVSGISPSVTPGTVMLGMAAGTIVSFIAVQIPALRGARTAPVEAMREARLEGGALSRRRWISAAILVGLGVAGLVANPNAWVVGASSISFIIGLFVAGPALAVLASRAATPVLRVTGMSGRLSAQNLERNPRRTSSTSNALVIGVLLVTLVTVAGTILQRWTVAEIEDQSVSDAVVTAFPGTALPASLIDDVQQISTVKRVVVVRSAEVVENGVPSRISTASPADLDAIGITADSGSFDRLGNGIAVLGTGGVVVQPDETDETGQPVDTAKLQLERLDGSTFSLPVTASITPSLDSFSLGYLVAPETLDALELEVVDSTAYVIAQPGESEATADEVARLSQGFSTVFAYAGNFFADIINEAFSFLINAINALLGMSVIIALIGIINTLSLSIFERRHEIGLLRAVGMSRREVKRMVRLEAVQIAVLGTLVGFVAGLALALLLIRAADFDAAISFNYARLGAILALGVVVGVVASIVPTRRVSRTAIVDAMRSE